jgi:hypothetical protein
MKTPARMRVLWHNYDDDFYQEMYVTHEQFMALLHGENLLNDVTGDVEHEEKFKKIKALIKEKVKGA